MIEAEAPSVLDASALIAFLLNEPGADIVHAALRTSALLSAVNLSEVLATIGSANSPFDDLYEYLMSNLFGGMLRVVPFDEAYALATARLRPLTRSSGLSLGDRACLALAQATAGHALTADRRWADVADAVGVTVRVIRP